ncbi:hypothetical protein BaRGS_00011069 [Batillaria attramentaria]|uniref:Uncharacterized protein n=1 Tax=Batillaria attramentaria TaxID=370345 RepID=A0ABD0LDX8_9CAEN
MGKMSSVLVFTSVFLLTSSCSAASGEIYPNNSVFYKLKSELLKGYSPDIRPVHNVSTVTNVTVKVKLGSLGDVNVREQKLSQTLFLYATWVDEFMSWDPEDYDGATDLLVRQKDIWIPDLVLGPAMTSARKLGVDSQYVRVTHKGLVNWSQDVVTVTACSVSIRYYPFDEQNCSWHLYLLASDKRHVELTFKKPDDLRSVEFSENVEWELMDYSVVYNSYVEEDLLFPALIFTYHLQRRPGFLLLTVISPTVMLSLLSALVFALPVESGEKMSLGVTMMLAFVFQLSFVTSVLPPSSLQTSILVVYLLVLCSCSATSVLLTVAVLSLHHRSDSVPLSPSAAGFVRLLHSWGRIQLSGETPQTPEALQRNFSTVSVAPDGTQQDAQQDNQLHGNGQSRSRPSGRGRINVTWPDVAVACDYVFFRLFLFIICMASIICFSLMAL